MEDSIITSLKGHFIVAVPDMMDPNFSDSVTCICDHTERSAMGVVVNRIHEDIKLKDIFDELKISVPPEVGDRPVFIGGPVQRNHIFILHGPPFYWEGCMKVSETLGLTNTWDILHAIGELKGPDSYIVALGAAGWAAGQLESELAASVWLTNPVVEDLLFNMPVEKRWNEIMKIMGIDPAMLSSTSGLA